MPVLQEVNANGHNYGNVQSLPELAAIPLEVRQQIRLAAASMQSIVAFVKSKQLLSRGSTSVSGKVSAPQTELDIAIKLPPAAAAAAAAIQSNPDAARKLFSAARQQSLPQTPLLQHTDQADIHTAGESTSKHPASSQLKSPANASSAPAFTLETATDASSRLQTHKAASAAVSSDGGSATASTDEGVKSSKSAAKPGVPSDKELWQHYQKLVRDKTVKMLSEASLISPSAHQVCSWLQRQHDHN